MGYFLTERTFIHENENEDTENLSSKVFKTKKVD